MDAEQTVQLELFDAFSQPVLLVQNGAVTARNKAAAAFGVQPGAAATDFVETGTDGAPVLHLGEMRVHAQVYPCAGGSAYIAEQSWAGNRLTPNALLSVAQAIRAHALFKHGRLSALDKISTHQAHNGRIPAQLRADLPQLLFMPVMKRIILADHTADLHTKPSRTAKFSWKALVSRSLLLDDIK